MRTSLGNVYLTNLKRVGEDNIKIFFLEIAFKNGRWMEFSWNLVMVLEVIESLYCTIGQAVCLENLICF